MNRVPKKGHAARAVILILAIVGLVTSIIALVMSLNGTDSSPLGAVSSTLIMATVVFLLFDQRKR
ncbi:hypothetical protein [Actinomyces trachealis]|uniref:hypothetical protein n=1 Tax=Actinomyces trachealis TaxID=2763540 RepID=UPI001892C1E3|nr:hypothetical protein [Actinomyces trachealis]